MLADDKRNSHFNFTDLFSLSAISPTQATENIPKPKSQIFKICYLISVSGRAGARESAPLSEPFLVLERTFCFGNLFNQWQKKCCRLAGACIGHTENILAFHYRGHSLVLDWAWIGVSNSFNIFY